MTIESVRQTVTLMALGSLAVSASWIALFFWKGRQNPLFGSLGRFFSLLSVVAILFLAGVHGLPWHPWLLDGARVLLAGAAFQLSWRLWVSNNKS